MNAVEQSRRSRQRAQILLLTAAMMLPGLCGCRFFVAMGKMVWGDPKDPSSFEQSTGMNLTESDDRVLIICSAPHRVQVEFPSVQLDLLDRISQNLENRGVQVVPPDDVADWYDDNGEWGDYSELAEHFDARYIMNLTLRTFTYVEPNSPNLLRGRSEGTVKVHDVKPDRAIPVQKAFERDVRVMFPEIHAVPRESNSDTLFLQQLLDRIALQTSQMFYDHRVADTIH